jgi:hypothetical protein
MARVGYWRTLEGNPCPACAAEALRNQEREQGHILEIERIARKIVREELSLTEGIKAGRHFGQAEYHEVLALIADLYYSAHREGWEEGPSVDEVCERAHNWLCNHEVDPYTNGGPEKLKAFGSELTSGVSA